MIDETKNVTVDWETLEIKVNTGLGGVWYPVDLERCNSSEEMLDWIWQLYSKSWMTPALMAEVLTVFEHACYCRFGMNPQGVFCPFGVGNKVDWKRGLFGDGLSSKHKASLS